MRRLLASLRIPSHVYTGLWLRVDLDGLEEDELEALLSSLEFVGTLATGLFDLRRKAGRGSGSASGLPGRWTPGVPDLAGRPSFGLSASGAPSLTTATLQELQWYTWVRKEPFL
jgi:hypothetical protein